MNKLLFIILLFGAAYPILLGQQLSNRTGVEGTDFVFNPALTAVNAANTGTVEHQRQWNGYDDAPVATRIAAQFSLDGGRMGAGIMLSQSKSIGLNRTLIGLTYAYHFGLGNGLLSGGLLAGVETWKNDFQGIAVVNPNDPILSLTWIGVPTISLGAGFRYQTNKYLGEDDENGAYLSVGSNQLLVTTVKDEDTDQPIFQRVVHANANAGYRMDNGTIAMDYNVWTEYSKASPFLVTARVQLELKGTGWASLAYGLSNGIVQPQVGVDVVKLDVGSVAIGLQSGIPFGTALAQPGSSWDFFVTFRGGVY